MMKRVMFSLCGLPIALLSLMSVAQNTTVNVLDDSPTDCLARMPGDVQLSESDVNGVHQMSFVDHISTTNVSQKTIVAMVIFSQIGTSYGPLIGQYHELDAFFSHRLEIPPGQRYTHRHEDNGTFSLPVPQDTPKIAPVTTSRVIYVQYADGTTCGNSEDAHVVALMDTRSETFRALQRLDEAAKIGEKEFLQTLSVKLADRNAENTVNNLRDQQKQEGTAAAIREVRDMLAVAATR